jgi:hypothetical protein
MKSDIEIVWADVPPRKYTSKYNAVIEALMANPGRWIMLPTPSKNSNSGLRIQVKRLNAPIKIVVRSRSDGMFDVYAMCTTGIAQDALHEAPDQRESNA